MEVETTSSKPKLESMLDGDFLNKLEGKMEKASISSLHDQLNQRMVNSSILFVRNVSIDQTQECRFKVTFKVT